MEIGEALKLQEIEEAFSRFKICPKCNSTQGFWLGIKRDIGYAQCKECGAKFELHEVYTFGERGKAPEKFKLLKSF
ncbi:MAG: hypothetical protein QMD20_00680 [Candidatus Bathyarchaeia archaeon]|nr:hypothetical protein [Candidatus Bathyarchaeia archaeon]